MISYYGFCVIFQLLCTVLFFDTLMLTRIGLNLMRGLSPLTFFLTRGNSKPLYPHLLTRTKVVFLFIGDTSPSFSLILVSSSPCPLLASFRIGWPCVLNGRILMYINSMRSSEPQINAARIASRLTMKPFACPTLSFVSNATKGMAEVSAGTLFTDS
jgi:hypothetical protein